LIATKYAVAIRTHELIYTNRFGQEIWREPRGTDAGYDVPQFSIHRGRLQGVIYHAVRARLGEARIHTGHRLGAFRQDESGVTAYFFDRHGGHRHTAQWYLVPRTPTRGLGQAIPCPSPRRGVQAPAGLCEVGRQRPQPARSRDHQGTQLLLAGFTPCSARG